jgi:hypothetical protein
LEYYPRGYRLQKVIDFHTVAFIISNEDLIKEEYHETIDEFNFDEMNEILKVNPLFMLFAEEI